MRRYAVTEAPRAILQHELAELIRRDEHLNPEKTDRINAWRRALAALKMGAPTAQARMYRFVVNDTLERRYGITEGTREEILAELDQYGADRARAGKEEKARRYATAIAVIGKGADDFEMDRILYRVVENDLGEPKRNPDQTAIDAERDRRHTAFWHAHDED